MQRDFDSELVQDREFRFGGEILRWRYPYYEDLFAIFGPDEVEESSNGEVTVRITALETFEDTLKRIEVFIDPADEGLKRFRALTRRKAPAVPAYQFTQLYIWLMGVASGNPTSSPAPSGDGGGDNGTSSPVESSSPAATPEG